MHIYSGERSQTAGSRVESPRRWRAQSPAGGTATWTTLVVDSYCSSSANQLDHDIVNSLKNPLNMPHLLQASQLDHTQLVLKMIYVRNSKGQCNFLVMSSSSRSNKRRIIRRTYERTTVSIQNCYDPLQLASSSTNRSIT